MDELKSDGWNLCPCESVLNQEAAAFCHGVAYVRAILVPLGHDRAHFRVSGRTIRRGGRDRLAGMAQTECVADFMDYSAERFGPAGHGRRVG